MLARSMSPHFRYLVYDIETCIDKALLRKGRMIAKYKFNPLSAEKTALLAQKLGHENVTGSLTLADIFEMDKRSFDNAARKGIGFPQP